MENNLFLDLIKNKKAFIFDLDGVLADTSKIHEEAFKKTLSLLSEYFSYKSYTGMSTEETFRKFLNDEKIISILNKNKKENVNQMINKIKLFEKVTDLLKLSKKNNIKNCLCTSASRERAYKILDNFNISELFDCIVTSNDVIKSKPDPSIYQKAIDLLNVKKNEAIVIEDAPNGIESAKRAGIYTIALMHTHNEELLSEADIVIEDLESLYSVLSHYFSSFKKEVPAIKFDEKIAIVICAAGKGTRLNFNGPKILFKIGNKTCLDILYEKLGKISKEIIVVGSSENSNSIRKYVSENKLPIKVVTAYNTRGTADSANAGLKSISDSDDALIIWGDQIGITLESVLKLINNHKNTGSDFSFPTIIRKNPYIHLERDSEGKIIKVKREKIGDNMPIWGENDSGVFFGNAKLIKDLLNKMSNEFNKFTLKDNEFDFLEIIPFISKYNLKLTTLACVSEKETMGLNTLDEAKFHENLLLNDD